MNLTRRGRYVRTVSIQLAIAVLAGMAWMAFAGAPQSYLAVNAIALALGLGAIAFLPMPTRRAARAWLALGLVVALVLTAIFGVESGGARRWFTVGPASLHTGYLVLPLAMALAARLGGWATTALLSLASLAALLQPDLAASAGLALAGLILAWRRKNVAALSGAVTAITLAIVCWTVDPLLSPVRFVENVVGDAGAAWGLALWVAQIAAVLTPNWRSDAAVTPMWLFVGWALLALAMPYPSVLIGYGAAPIIGLALARAEARAALRP